MAEPVTITKITTRMRYVSTIDAAAVERLTPEQHEVAVEEVAARVRRAMESRILLAFMPPPSAITTTWPLRPLRF